jgi:UDP-N-acetylglucosamine acyltransferase
MNTIQFKEKKMIHNTAIVDPTAELDSSVEVGPYAIIGKSVKIRKNTVIGAYSHIEHADIGENCNISYYVCIGAPPQDIKYAGKKTRVVIGDNCIVREYSTIHRASKTDETTVGKNCYLMSYIHIGHDCVIGDEVTMANCASLGGHTHIENYAVLGALVGVHQFSRIGELTMLGAGTMAAQDVPPYTMACGDRAELFGLNVIGLKRRKYSTEKIKSLKTAYHILFSSKKPLKEALEQLEKNEKPTAETKHLVDFIRSSKRGICHSV